MIEQPVLTLDRWIDPYESREVNSCTTYVRRYEQETGVRNSFFFLYTYTTCGGGGLQNHPCKLQTYATLLVPSFNPSNASWGGKIDGVKNLGVSHHMYMFYGMSERVFRY
jgi:hypothetical protein